MKQKRNKNVQLLRYPAASTKNPDKWRILQTHRDVITRQLSTAHLLGDLQTFPVAGAHETE